MKSKKTVINSNYLEKIPQKANIPYKTENDKIVLEIENKGFVNFIAQKLFKKPRVSFVHLDELGSFIWPLIDGQKDIIAIGKEVEKHFGEKANPLYERLASYFRVLESYKFISFK